VGALRDGLRARLAGGAADRDAVAAGCQLPVDEVREALVVDGTVARERGHEGGDRTADLRGVAAELHAVSLLRWWRNASRVASRWLRATSSISSASAPDSMRLRILSCSRTDSRAL